MVEPPSTRRPTSPCMTVVQGGSVWSNHTELTQTYPVGMHPMHYSSSLRFGLVEPPRTHLKLHCRPCITVVRGGSVWSNHLKLTRTYPVGLHPPSSQRFGVVVPLRSHLKLPCKSAYPVVEGGSVWLNHPKLTQNCPIGLLPNGSKWLGEWWNHPEHSPVGLLFQKAKWLEEVWCG